MSLVLYALAIALAAPADPRAASAPADLVLRGGVVHTVDAKRPRAEAVAVREGRIVAVGSDAEVAALVGPRTRVVELAGRTVVPGFDDAHAHLLGIGFARLDVDLTGTRTFDEVVARVAAELRTRRPGEWVRGRGWHEGKWVAPAPGAVRGFPTHAALTAVSPDNPVVLERADGHAVLANARAMALRGVGRETRPPAGGEVIRDADGAPTGVFVDNAQSLVEPPERTLSETERALELAMDECLAKGVTSLTDAGQPLEVVDLLRRFDARGGLRVRLNVMAGGFRVMKALGAPSVPPPGGMLTVRSVKLYADDPGNRGLLVTPPAELLEAARWALAHGFQAGTHAIGDRANRVVLDAYETAFREHPEVKDPRFRVEHAQVLDPADVPRFGRLGVLASMQGIHCPSDRPWAVARLGPARLAGAYAWRSLLASGARILNGTDAPVEDASPILNFHATVTRQDERGNPPGGFDPEQKLTRAEALRTMTLDAAYGSFEEGTRGSIEPGKLADLVVLSQDILSVPDAALLDTKVDLAVVSGRVLFER